MSWTATWSDRVPYRLLLLDIMRLVGQKRVEGDVMATLEGLRTVYDFLWADLRVEVLNGLSEEAKTVLEHATLPQIDGNDMYTDRLSARRVTEILVERKAAQLVSEIQRKITDVLFRHGLLVWKEEEIEVEKI